MPGPHGFQEAGGGTPAPPHPPELKLPTSTSPKACHVPAPGRQQGALPPSFPSLRSIKAIQCLAPLATQFVHHVAVPHVHVRPGTQDGEEHELKKKEEETNAAA